MNAITMTSLTSKKGNKLFRNNSISTHKALKNILSSSKRVIVQYDENTAGFVENAYLEQYLGRYISEKEFEEIISYCSRRMQKFWMFVKENDKSELPKDLKSMSIVIIAIFLVYIVGVFLVLEMESYNTFALYVCFFCFVIGVSITFALNLYNHFRTYQRFKSPEELLKDELDEYFKTVNPKYPEIEFSYNLMKNRIEIDILRLKEDDHSSHHSEKPKEKEGKKELDK